MSAAPVRDEAARGAIIDAAAREVRSAGTIRAVEAAMRQAVRALQGDLGMMRFSPNPHLDSVDTVRELALGVLDAVEARPELVVTGIGARHGREDRDAYAVTRVAQDGSVRLEFNAYWIDSRLRDDFVSELIGDGRAGLPGTIRELAKRQLLAAHTPGEFTARRAGAATSSAVRRPHLVPAADPSRYNHRGPLDLLRDIQAEDSLGRIEEHLRRALGALLNREVRVDLGRDGATDLESAKDISRGLISTLMADRTSPDGPVPEQRPGPVEVTVGAVPDEYAHAYAVSLPNGDGTHRLLFNARWHSPDRRDGYVTALQYEASLFETAADPAAVAAAHARPPASPAPRVTASPRVDHSPGQYLRFILESTDTSEISHLLSKALEGTTGQPVSVAIPWDVGVVNARELAAGLIRATLEHPDPGLLAVSVDRLPRTDAAALAVTRPLPGGTRAIVFNHAKLTARERPALLGALRDARSAGTIPEASLAGLAATRVRALGQDALTPEQRREHIDSATTVAEIEEHLRAALWGTVGHAVAVDLQGSGNSRTHLETAREVARGLIDASLDFPGAGNLMSVRVGKLPDRTYARVTGGRHIIFNTRWHREDARDVYLKALAHNSTVHFHPRLYSAAAVAVHEFTHIVTAGIAGWKDGGLVAGHVGRLWDDIREKTGLVKKTNGQLAASTSRYATKNDNEFAAEAVADVYANGRANAVSATAYDRLKAAHRALADPRLRFAQLRGYSAAKAPDLSLTRLVDIVRKASAWSSRERGPADDRPSPGPAQARASPGADPVPQRGAVPDRTDAPTARENRPRAGLKRQRNLRK